ncbi:MAG: XRE family transcriptional regulator [Desulfobacteraceae bacterium]|nr:MAG: XRE family transcriptional regulator [Desulfobacteraceae bacterium]
MTEAKILLGKRIRSLRRSKDYSQEEFAELAEISGKYLGEIERGQANLSLDIVEKISNAFNIEIAELFDFQHESTRKEMRQKITLLLKKVDYKNLQIIYRIIRCILK